MGLEQQLITDEAHVQEGEKGNAEDGAGWDLPGCCYYYGVVVPFLRLVCAAVLVFGIPELVLAYVTANSKLADAHYQYDEKGFINFVPIPGCKLPPNQPFVMEFGMNAVKIVMLTLAFGGINIDGPEARASRSSRYLYVLLAVYQLMVIPLSMLSLVAHFVQNSDAISTRWDLYQCFGISWTLGPWWFNSLFLLFKLRMSGNTYIVNISELLPKEEEGLLYSLSGSSFPCCWYSLRLGVTLKSEVSQVHLMMSKLALLHTTYATTLLPYCLLWFPFLVTHIIPGLVLFFPGIVILVLACGVLLWCVAVEPEFSGRSRGQMISVLARDAFGGGGDGMAWPTVYNSGGLILLPVLSGLSVAAQVIMLQTVYFYEGDSWWNSLQTVWLERRTSVYVGNFVAKVLSEFWVFSSLLNEIF